jgi:hypothetical protein
MRATSRVTQLTQARFEELYFNLTQIYNEYTLSAKIASILDTTTMAIYMRFRQNFTTGTEKAKAALVKAMEQIRSELIGVLEVLKGDQL